MNNAEKKIHEIIGIDGFITVDQFFKIASEYYYKNCNPFGSAGDFITAPEISQLFGDVIGVWCASTWMKLGSQKFTLVEMGGGKGTLMSDILRATKNVKGFHTSLEKVVMIETSDSLALAQQEKLKAYDNVVWVKSIEEVQADNCIFICNELFDALPFKQYIGSQERVIIIKDNNLMFKDVNENVDVTEVSEVAQKLCEEIKRISLAALIIDYGYLEAPKISTLQAVKKHEYTDVFANIGEVDLTYNVDFSALLKCFKEARVITQSSFLKEYGIELRAQKLVEQGYEAVKMKFELDRLISPTQMGELFKVLEFVKKS